MSKWIERLLIAAGTFVVGAFMGYKAGQNDALEDVKEHLVDPLLTKFGVQKTDAIGSDAMPESPSKAD